MTSQEHLLMVTIYAKQMQLIKTLTEALRSKGVLDDGDFQAYENLVRSDEDTSRALLADATRVYLEVAKNLGIPIALKG